MHDDWRTEFQAERFRGGTAVDRDFEIAAGAEEGDGLVGGDRLIEIF